MLWVPSYHEGKFFRFDPATRDFREYALPTGRADMVYALAIDARDDSIWLCGTNSDTLKIHILNGLTCGPLHKVIDRRKNDHLLSIRMDGDVAKVCILYPIDVGRTVDDPHEK